MFTNEFCIYIADDVEWAKKGDYILLYVRALNGGAYLQVEMYKNDMKESVWTEVLDNSKEMEIDEGGKRKMCSYTIFHPEHGAIPDKIAREFASYIGDVVRYVMVYMNENMHNPEYVYETSEVKNVKVQNGKKKTKSKALRRKIYVPRRIVVKETRGCTKQVQNGACKGDLKNREYYMSQWKARSYVRRVKHKDGTVDLVTVSGSVRKRNPKLLEKKSDGADYILKKRG